MPEQVCLGAVPFRWSGSVVSNPMDLNELTTALVSHFGWEIDCRFIFSETRFGYQEAAVRHPVIQRRTMVITPQMGTCVSVCRYTVGVLQRR